MKKTTFSLVLFTFFNFYIYAQISSQDKEHFKWFDQLTDAQNSHLSNGVSYFEDYITKKGHHQYYFTPDFLIGNLKYDQQHYFDVNLQYNLYSDELILRFYKGENLRTIQLIKDKVESFTVNKKYFVKVIENAKPIFYEKLLSTGETHLYKRHYKTRQRHISESQVYYSFKKKDYHVIYHKGQYHTINGKRNLLKIFPERKASINTFFSKNNRLYNLNRDAFLKSLLQHIRNE